MLAEDVVTLDPAADQRTIGEDKGCRCSGNDTKEGEKNCVFLFAK